MAENKDSLTDVINSSGFLFQLRLEEEIKKSRPVSPIGEWQQIAREHKWIDSLDGKEGFIDIVLESGGTPHGFFLCHLMRKNQGVVNSCGLKVKPIYLTGIISILIRHL